MNVGENYEIQYFEKTGVAKSKKNIFFSDNKRERLFN
jgi:hypothetical protein